MVKPKDIKKRTAKKELKSKAKQSVKKVNTSPLAGVETHECDFKECKKSFKSLTKLVNHKQKEH